MSSLAKRNTSKPPTGKKEPEYLELRGWHPADQLTESARAKLARQQGRHAVMAKQALYERAVHARNEMQNSTK
jgi:hypothetical protein